MKELFRKIVSVRDYWRNGYMGKIEVSSTKMAKQIGGKVLIVVYKLDEEGN
jgi:hypothetical protein